MSTQIIGKLRGNNPAIRTYGDLIAWAARHVSPRAERWGKRAVHIIAYAYLLGSCTIYLITMKISIMEIFQECPSTSTTPAPLWSEPALTAEACATSSCGNSGCSSTHGVTHLHETAWLFIVAAITYPFLQIRTMADAAIVSYIGVATIAIVNVIIIVRSAIQATKDDSVLQCPFNRSFLDIVNGMTQLAFAYGGHVIMPDIMAEMREPSKFSKSVLLSQFFMFANYAIVGFVS